MASDPPEELTLEPSHDAQGDANMTAMTGMPTASEQAALHGPPGTETGTPRDTPPRGPTTDRGDHGGGGTTDNATATTKEDDTVDGAGAPSDDGTQGPTAAAQPPPFVDTNSIAPVPTGGATSANRQRIAEEEGRRLTEEAAHREFSAAASRISWSPDPSLTEFSSFLGGPRRRERRSMSRTHEHSTRRRFAPTTTNPTHPTPAHCTQ